MDKQQCGSEKHLVWLAFRNLRSGISKPIINNSADDTKEWKLLI